MSMTSVSAKRGHWSSRLGFVLAAAGSAIGLGNLWKFPYMTWENNGGAFVLLYIVFVAIVGLPIMMSEILIGRRTEKNPVGAMQEVTGRPVWGAVGGLGVTTGFIILGYYTVIAGWALRWVYDCLRWSFTGFNAERGAAGHLSEFLANGPLQVTLSAAFMLLTVFVVLRGVSHGIERAARLLMPALFVILLLMLGSALSMEGASTALNFLFVPDFSNFNPPGALEALGQAFFSLSLGMGAMITYGSYLSKSESVPRSAAIVVLLDTLIAICAALIMFSVIFSVPGMADDVGASTVGMLFTTLPNLFYEVVPFGVILAPLFYLLVAFAALTSTISLLEVVASYFIDQRGWTRFKATTLSGSVIFVLSLLCALSFGASRTLSEFSWIYTGTPNAKQGLFSHLDYLAANWMLPVGGFFITLAAGWVMTREDTRLELVDERKPPWFSFGAWRFFIRYIAPLAVAAIIGAVMSGKDFS